MFSARTDLDLTARADMMGKCGVAPVTATYNSVISACEKGGEWERALHWCSPVPTRSAPTPSPHTHLHKATCVSTLNSSPAVDLSPSLLRRRFERLQADPSAAPDVVSYNALIAALGKAGQAERAQEAFAGLRAARLRPNTITASALLSALGSRGRWEEASSFFATLPALGIRPNAVTYNALIAACAAGGQWGLAAAAFQDMRVSGLSPDRMTFNPLLSVLWAGGQFAYAQALMRKALEEAVYDDPLRRGAGAWAVDMHRRAGGGAPGLHARTCTPANEHLRPGSPCRSWGDLP